MVEKTVYCNKRYPLVFVEGTKKLEDLKKYFLMLLQEKLNIFTLHLYDKVIEQI